MPYTTEISLQVKEDDTFNEATLNYLAPTGFKLQIDGLTYPNTEYNVQTVSLPEISVPGAAVNLQRRNIAMTADKVNYGNLTVVFLVDENLQNYKEMHDWMLAIVNNEDARQDGKVRDLTLTILNSHNNVNKQIQFIDAFPIDVSALPFDLTSTDVTYLQATITFQYSYFKIL